MISVSDTSMSQENITLRETSCGACHREIPDADPMLSKGCGGSRWRDGLATIATSDTQDEKTARGKYHRLSGLALQKTVVTMCGVLLPLERLQVFNEDKEIPADHLLAD